MVAGRRSPAAALVWAAAVLAGELDRRRSGLGRATAKPAAGSVANHHQRIVLPR
jgi:hypothetical protein